MEFVEHIKQCGYQVKAMLQNKAYIFRDDDEMVAIPLDELRGKTRDEIRARIERQFQTQTQQGAEE